MTYCTRVTLATITVTFEGIADFDPYNVPEEIGVLHKKKNGFEIEK